MSTLEAFRAAALRGQMVNMFKASFTLLAFAALASIPFTTAHEPVGAPREECDATAGQLETHEYGPNNGFTLLLPTDGSLPPCASGTNWDGHYEFASGGAWLLADEAGATTCFGTIADHSPFPFVQVHDALLGDAVVFSVYADALNNVPPLDPAEPDCGDYESDYGVWCEGSCSIGFPPGLDGSYQVYVSGTTGHVAATLAPNGGCCVATTWWDAFVCWIKHDMEGSGNTFMGDCGRLAGAD